MLLYEELTSGHPLRPQLRRMVITGVADRMPERIAKLVYVDAFVPDDGNSWWDLAVRITERLRSSARVQMAVASCLPRTAHSRCVAHPLRLVVRAFVLRDAERSSGESLRLCNGMERHPVHVYLREIEERRDAAGLHCRRGTGVIREAPEEFLSIVIPMKACGSTACYHGGSLCPCCVMNPDQLPSLTGPRHAQRRLQTFPTTTPSPTGLIASFPSFNRFLKRSSRTCPTLRMARRCSMSPAAQASPASRWRIANPHIHLLGVDAAAAMIGVARTKAARQSLPNIRFEVMSSDHMTVPDGSMDGLVSRFGLLMFGDVPASRTRNRPRAAARWRSSASLHGMPWIATRCSTPTLPLCAASCPLALAHPSRTCNIGLKRVFARAC